MLKKFLKEVVVIVVGKQAEEIVALLEGDKYVNEFIIAKKFNITINQTRNILYKISDQGLVSSIRKKDKKKGWYTYFWKMEVLKSLEFLRGVILKNIEQIRNQIKSRETKRFYICERCNIEFNEENAMLNDFTCNECGEVFAIKDNEKVLKEFKKNEKRLEDKLKLVNIEITKEKQRLEKERLKELKKLEKEKVKQKKKAGEKPVKKPAGSRTKSLASPPKNRERKKVVKKKSAAKKKKSDKKSIKKKKKIIKRPIKKKLSKKTKVKKIKKKK